MNADKLSVKTYAVEISFQNQEMYFWRDGQKVIKIKSVMYVKKIMP